MDVQRTTPREAILRAARHRLAADPSAPVATIAFDAGVSRATFYRHFGTRAELLDALDIEPDPDARERILAAAEDLIGRDGLRGMSMDALAEAAGVSRASVYRLFPGKSAVFAALLATSSPFDEIAATLHRLRDHPPDEVLPEVLRTAARIAEPRIALLRTLMLEVSAGAPEAVEAARWVIQPLFGEASAYFAGQMAAGNVRQMHPILAAQAFMGPLVLFLIARSLAGTLAGLDVETSDAVATFSQISLHGLLPRAS
jgi:AcrR family transcriptional regulator